jgi:ubiquitin conjugation factor E4 B
LGLIKDSFLFLSGRLDIQEDTRINADQHGADEFTNDLKQSSENQSNFVSEIFFLTFAYHHYGILSIIRYSGNLGKQLDKMKEQVEKLRQDELNGAWDGPMRTLYSNQFKNFQNQFDKMIGEKLATDGVLMDKHNIEHSIKFYNLAILWLIRCASAEKYDVDTFNRKDLPALMKGDSKHSEIMHLPPQSPKLFSVIPEWMFDDVCEFYLYVLRVKTNYFEAISRDEIVTFALIFLSNSSYLRNPYLKSKLVEILYHFTHALYQDSMGRTFGNLNDVFLTHTFARQNLIHCLTTFYIDVEQSGMHSQFYEKFSIRYHISQIFKSVWDDSHHRKMFIQESKKKEQFVRFAALLMNDTTYLLDESLSKLKEIQTIQNELDVPLSNPGQEEQEARNQKLQTLEQYERQALSTMSLGRETVNMFKYLTGCSEMIDPFMAPEVVDRLAAMLNFNLVALCGPRCSELKVREPEKYRFNPKELLNNLVQIYINLSERSEFVMAVAKYFLLI